MKQNIFYEVNVYGTLKTKKGITAKNLEDYINEEILVEYRFGLCNEAADDGNIFEACHFYDEFILSDFEDMLRRISDRIISGELYFRSDTLDLFKRYTFVPAKKSWKVANAEILFPKTTYTIAPEGD